MNTEKWKYIDNQGNYINTIAIVAKTYRKRPVDDWFKNTYALSEHFQVWELMDDAKEATEQFAKVQFGKHFIALLTFKTKTRYCRKERGAR